MDIYKLAENLAQEIEESGKTKWSAKDVKEFFLSEGFNLSLDEILQVWDACPSPVCACELLGCDAIMASEDNSPEQMQEDMNNLVAEMLDKFMRNWDNYIEDFDMLDLLITSAVDEYVNNSDYFYMD